MRKTSHIDDEAVEAAKNSVRNHKKPAVRFTTRNGVPQLPKRGKGKPVTMELVNRLRDEIPG